MGDGDSLKIPKKDKEFKVKMKIGGQEKEMTIDTGFSGEIFVDADNFKKVKGTKGPGINIEDATGTKTKAQTKTDVEVTLTDLDITVKKEVIGLKKGGSNLVGLEYFPNLSGIATAVLDLVGGEIVITKKPKKGKKVKKGAFVVKVPFIVPPEDIVSVPFVVPQEEEEEEEEKAKPKEKVVKVPFVVPPQEEEEEEEKAKPVKPREKVVKVPFVVPPQEEEEEEEEK